MPVTVVFVLQRYVPPAGGHLSCYGMIFKVRKGTKKDIY